VYIIIVLYLINLLILEKTGEGTHEGDLDDVDMIDSLARGIRDRNHY
jgi:hypothetical protein